MYGNVVFASCKTIFCRLLHNTCRTSIIQVLFLLFAIIAIAAYAYISTTAYNCRTVFESGSPEWDTTHALITWKPTNCRLRYRTASETSQCLDKLSKTSVQPIMFVGDYRVKQLWSGLISTLTGQSNWVAANNYSRKETEFIIFESQPDLDDGSGTMTQFIRNLTTAPVRPSLLVLGPGSEVVRECERRFKPQDKCALIYQKYFMTLLPLLEELALTTDVLWLPQTAINERMLHTEHEFGLNNEYLHLYNIMVREILEPNEGGKSPVIFWKSAWEMSVKISHRADSFRLGYRLNYHLVQVLMDWICKTKPIESFQYRFIERDDFCC